MVLRQKFFQSIQMNITRHVIFFLNITYHHIKYVDFVLIVLNLNRTFYNILNLFLQRGFRIQKMSAIESPVVAVSDTVFKSSEEEKGTTISSDVEDPTETTESASLQ